MQETQEAWVRSLGQEDLLEERIWWPISVFLLGESYEQKNLADYSPWGHRGLDMTEATERTCTYVVFKHYHWFSDSKITMNIENLATDANNFWGKNLKGLGTISQFNMQYFGVFFFFSAEYIYHRKTFH